MEKIRFPKPLSKPAILLATHDLSNFDSGEPVLDEWLRRRAMENTTLGASRTYVVCASGSNQVVGFFSLSMGQIFREDALGSMRRNMPNTIPAIVLGRLAVDKTCQGLGLGSEMLRDVVRRALIAAAEISARLLIVHPISNEAENFYLHHGFVRLPVEAPIFALDLVKMQKAQF